MLKFLICFMLFCFPAFSATFTVSNTDTLATFASVEAFNAYTNTTAISSGDTVYFNNCDTFTGIKEVWLSQLNKNNWDTNNPVTFTSYGTCTNRKPTWDITSDWTASWTLVSGNVYKSNVNSQVGEGSNTRVYHQDLPFLLEDDVKMIDVKYTTDEATTIAMMTAGSFSENRTTKDVYIYTSDGAAPTTHDIEYGGNNAVIYCNDQLWRDPVDHKCGGLVIDGLEFRHTNTSAIVTGKIDNVDGLKESHGIQVKNSTFVECGGAVQATGDYANIYNNRAIRSGSGGAQEDSNALFSINSGATFEISYNEATDCTRLSALVEMNFGSSYGSAHHNKTNASGQCLECYASTNHVDIYKNECLNQEPQALNTTVGILYGEGTQYVSAYNNIIQGHSQACHREQGSLNENNKFNYNTCITSSTGVGVLAYDNAGANEIIGNIFYSTSTTGIGKLITARAGSTDTVYDYNMYWNANEHTVFAAYDEVDYATFEAYQSASGQDTHSSYQDPLLNTDYSLKSNSPARDAGITLAEVLDDYLGITRPKGSAYDIGAFEFQLAPGIYIR